MKPYLISFALVCLVTVAGLREVSACTCITVGKEASKDGSVMTSHTCDSHRTASDIQVVKRRNHKAGATIQLTTREEDNSGPMERYGRKPTGPIPQVLETYAYLAPAYAAMNEHQLAIGESTFGGRKEAKSDQGLIDCETLTRLVLERCKTAREAVRTAGELLGTYGWIDEGEILIFTDPQEAWHMEIIGSGKDKVGAIWAAQRIPDDHVSVAANGARIGVIDDSKSDWYMASDNVRKVALDNGWWEADSGIPFRFNYAYDPKGRTSKSVTRREWRVLSLLAPSRQWDPEGHDFPFSIKPEQKLGPETIMELFRDTYEGTDYDMVGTCCNVPTEEGKSIKSPLANPFMPYDMNRMLRIQGGWGWRGERSLARWYAMYVTVTQSREWLPAPVGGIVWFGYDNPATTTYVPLYVGITELPEDYRTDGRTTGFSRKVAWWAFNRVATLAAHRWGDMLQEVAAVRDPLQKGLLDSIVKWDEEASRLYKKKPKKAHAFLTQVVATACSSVVGAYWKLGDHLWTRYDEKW
jgi:dipeptidase